MALGKIWVSYVFCISWLIIFCNYVVKFKFCSIYPKKLNFFAGNVALDSKVICKQKIIVLERSFYQVSVWLPQD